MESRSREFGKAVQRGTRLVLLAQFASQIISLLVFAALYRLVARESFGLIGMLVPLMMLLRMVATQGLGVATIQEKKLTEQQLTSLFWLNLYLGIAAAALTCAGSVGLAYLYGAQELIAIGIALSGTCIVAAGGSQHFALLEKNLRFGTAIRVKIVGQVAGGVAAIAAAWWLRNSGASGVWALIVQQYVELTINLVGGWLVEAWRPGKPTRIRAIGSLIRFTGFYGGANVVFFLSRNIDKVILSLLFGSTPGGREIIGMYSQAFNQMMKPVQLVTSPLSGILLPALSKARDDAQTYAKLVSQFFRLATLVLAPSAVGLYVVAVDGFGLLGGVDWIDAGRLLEALALVIVAQGLINLCGSLFASKGHASHLFAGSITVFFVLLAAISCGAFVAGLDAVPLTLARSIGWSFAVGTAVICPLYVAVCLGICGVSRRLVAKELALPIGTALWMGVVTWTLREILTRTSVGVEVRVTIVIVAGAAFYIWLSRDLLRRSIHELFAVASHQDDPLPPQSDVNV